MARSAGPSRGQRLRYCGGFTLMELLVVTAIIGVLVAAVAACLAGGIRVWEVVQHFGQVEADAAIGVRMMERDLRNTFPFFAVPFKGDAHGMTFPVRVLGVGAEAEEGEPASESPGAVTYEFDPGGQRIRRRVRVLPDGAEREDTVVTAVAEVECRYFAEPQKPGQQGRWMEEWTNPSNNPGRVSFRIVLLTEDGRLVRERLVLLRHLIPRKAAP